MFRTIFKKLTPINFYWLIFLIPILSVGSQLPLKLQVIFWLLIVVWLATYFIIYLSRGWLTLSTIWLQLGLDAIFSIWLGYPYLFIFTGFFIGSERLEKKSRLGLVGGYYLLAVGLYIGAMLALKGGNLYEALINGLFIILSLPAAYYSSERRRRHIQIVQDNERLTYIVKKAERERIAQELHDNLGQSFSVLALKAELAKKLAVKDPALASQQLDDIAKTARADLDLVREIVAGLRKDLLVQTLAQESINLKLAKMGLKTEGEKTALNWPEDIQELLAQVIKEVSTNCIRHSGARDLTLIFSHDETNYYLKASDDGQGFKTDLSKETYGLSGIQKRVASFGGEVSFRNQGGAVIELSLPKKG